MALGETQGRLPGPIALLQAKIANVADLAQSGRQDARHLMILWSTAPAYLEDLQNAAADGRLVERKLIGLLAGKKRHCSTVNVISNRCAR